MKGRREGAILFSPVKANRDLSVVEFVHSFENRFTMVNSQTRKKQEETFVRHRISHPCCFFLFQKCGRLAQFFKMVAGGAFGRQIP